MGLQWPGGGGGGGDPANPDITTIVKNSSGNVLATDFGEKSFVRMDTNITAKTLTFTTGIISTLNTGASFSVWKTGTGVLNLVRGAGITFESPYGDVNLQITGTEGYVVFVYITDTNQLHLIGPVEA